MRPPSQPMTPLAAKLTAARKAAGLSISDVARRMPEVSRATVGHWFTGERQPLMDNLKRLCEILDVSLSSVIADDPDFAQTAVEKLLLRLARDNNPATVEAVLALLEANRIAPGPSKAKP